MTEKLIDIQEGGTYKYNGANLMAVFAGMTPNRCKDCYFNRRNIKHCFLMACRADEREDGRNVYFINYDSRKGKEWN